MQQVAAPHQLYDQPANVFVAGFIGNPPMNLFPTRLSSDAAGGCVVSVGDQTLRVERAWRAAEGVTLTAGIRPEAFRLAADGTNALRVIVEHVEYLGHETLAHVRVGAADGPNAVRLITRLQGMHEFNRGAAIGVQLDADRLYLFEPAGAALSA